MHTKVLLIDDNAIFCNGVQRLLEMHNMEVITTTSDGNIGIKLATQH